MNLRNCLVAVLALVLIWVAVVAVLRLTEPHTSTPEKVLDLMATAPWLTDENASEAARKKRLDEIIDNLNRLDFDQRRNMQDQDREIRKRFQVSLTKEEQMRFVKETVEHNFRSVMKAFNQMPREERQRIVTQSLHDMDKNPNGNQEMQRLHDEDEQVFDKVVEKGLSAYYQDASSETKIDLEPLMQRMQDRIRGFRH